MGRVLGDDPRVRELVLFFCVECERMVTFNGQQPAGIDAERRAEVWTRCSHGRRRAPVAPAWVVSVALLAASTTGGTAQERRAEPLIGSWRLQETSGELPAQAARVLDGETGTGAETAIRIDQAGAFVTVRRVAPAATVLRTLALAPATGDPQAAGGGALRMQAAWRDQTLVAEGHMTVKQGFLKRTVPVEEAWHVDPAGRTLTVTTTLKTPLGVKQRTQVFARTAEGEPEGEAPAAGSHERRGHEPLFFSSRSEQIITCDPPARGGSRASTIAGRARARKDHRVSARNAGRPGPRTHQEQI